MVTKVLAAVFAVAVLTVGGYTYWQYADGCCGTPPASDELTTVVSASAEVPPCCQTPSRVGHVSAASGGACCDDIDFNAPAKPEVLTIQPREVP